MTYNKNKFADETYRNRVFWILAIGLNVFTIFYLLPRLLHFLDTKEGTIRAEELIQNGNQAGTRNLSIIGKVLDSEVTLTVSRRGVSKSTYYRPLVPSNYDGTAPISILVQSDSNISGSISISLAESFGETTEKGVLRDILMEGPPSSVIKEFEESYKYSFTDKVYLLDKDANTLSDFLLAVTVFSIADGLLLIIRYFMNKK